MTDFSHLQSLQVTSDKTAEYPLVEIEGDYVLVVRSANEGNKDYMNELLRLTGQGRGQRRAKVKVDIKAMDAMRDNDKILYPKHVIVGWKGVQDSKGKNVPFTAEAANDFIASLPNWIFDGLRGFANDPENFVLTIDSEDKAGN